MNCQCLLSSQAIGSIQSVSRNSGGGLLDLPCSDSVCLTDLLAGLADKSPFAKHLKQYHFKQAPSDLKYATRNIWKTWLSMV